MNIKRILLLILFVFTISFFLPLTSVAANSSVDRVSNDSFVIRIIEKMEYFFAFGTDKKVEVLEKQAERKLDMVQSNVKDGDNGKVSNLLQNYLEIKNRQNDLLNDAGEEMIDKVEERTLGQQMIMEEIKVGVDEGIKQNVIQVQEQVVNQVAQRIVEVNGKEGQTEFFNKVEHVWAPGTGPGGPPPGVTYEGGARLIFAPGTSEGGGGVIYEGGAGQQYAPGSSVGGEGRVDIKTVEVKGN